ncbi:Ger(x)C family spore germination protein [Rossellomorea vietnamensis]|uniref:Ger(X)C family spore germination protein n=1 Tax=Rossellomorea vietnamensis TaxID=218284 RepID=A0ACD4CCT1_9BACI|nr:Ger(x)C family spore germination protein [Rossellomorea vietnamensis]UXH46499.1 Ger(x)C family spore germination protein [Rossellomorea vietnamensis]
MNLSKLRLITILFILLGTIVVGFIRNNQLNEVELVSGLGIDQLDGQYAVTLQIFNPSANQKNSVDPTGGFTYTQIGKTIPEAIEKIKKESLKEPILDTLQVVTLSERLVKEEGLKETLDFLVRNPRIPASINTIIVKNDSPESFLTLFTPQEKLTALYTNTMLRNSKAIWGSLVNTSSERILSYLTDRTSDIIVPYVEIHGDIAKGMTKENIERFSPASHVSLEGFATFKGEKLNSYLTNEESNTLALMRGVNQVVNISAPCGDSNDEFTIKTISTSASLKADTEPVSFRLKVKIKGNLDQLGCGKDLTKLSSLKTLESQLEKKIKSDMDAVIKKSKEDGTDVLGLKDALYRQEPKMWEKKRNEKDFLATVNVDTSVTVEFIRFGHVKQ